MAIRPYRGEGHSYVEELGLRMQKFSDRCVSCCAGTEEPGKDGSARPMRADLLREGLVTALLPVRTLVSRMPIHLGRPQLLGRQKEGNLSDAANKIAD
jgi:hypothetical protein